MSKDPETLPPGMPLVGDLLNFGAVYGPKRRAATDAALDTGCGPHVQGTAIQILY